MIMNVKELTHALKDKAKPVADHLATKIPHHACSTPAMRESVKSLIRAAYHAGAAEAAKMIDGLGQPAVCATDLLDAAEQAGKEEGHE